MSNNAFAFKQLVRRILQEEIQKRVPEMDGNGLNSDLKNKRFASDPNSREKKTKDEMEAELTAAAQKVNKTAYVRWDDHDDITINVNDLFHVRITPLWEDNFKIVWFNRNEDRVVFTGVTWDQVLEFVKDNLDQKNIHTGIEKSRDKAWRNAEEKEDKAGKGLPQDDKPKKKEVGNSSNKEKNFNQEQVTDKENLPNAPMKEVGKLDKQLDHKVKDPVKAKKHLNKNKSHFSKS